MYGRAVNRLGVATVRAALVGLGLWGCGGAPEPRGPAASSVSPVRQSAAESAPLPDLCAPRAGEPPPEPLAHRFTGVAAKARCQEELYSIMSGVSRALAVQCEYCHLVPDYRALTHRKQIANWMANELVPALRVRATKQTPWCNDCHASLGHAAARFLGDPRDTSLAIEWMTTHLVEDFETKSGAPLKCKGCHRENLDSPQFQRKIIMTDLIPTAD